MECVYCVVRRHCLNLVFTEVVPWLRRLVAGLGYLQVQVMWDLRWAKWHWDRFCSTYFKFSVRCILPVLHTSHLHAAATRTNGRRLGGNLRKSSAVSEFGEHVLESAAALYRISVYQVWLVMHNSGNWPAWWNEMYGSHKRKQVPWCWMWSRTCTAICRTPECTVFSTIQVR